MLNINVSELRMTLYKTLKTVYTGDLYLNIDEICLYFENEDIELADDVTSVKITGNYGRNFPENDYQKLDETFTLVFDYPLPSLEYIAGYFEKTLLP